MSKDECRWGDELCACLEDGAWGAEITADAETLSKECVFYVEGTSRRPVLPVRRNKGKQEIVWEQVNSESK